MPTSKLRRVPRSALAALVLIAVRAGHADAVTPCVVGAGSAPSCTEAALDACLPGGSLFTGSVNFNCGGAATIVVTATKELNADTAIDGGGVITLDGGNAVRVLHVAASTTVGLQGLTIAHGNKSDGAGGGVSNEGSLTVSAGTFLGNVGTAGGAIDAQGSTVVSDSVFAENRASSGAGGGAQLEGTVHIERCVFTGNHATAYGGGLVTIADSDGAAVVETSVFYDNASDDSGGGYYNVGFETTLKNDSFYSNAAIHGGAVGQAGRLLTITNSTFVGNVAQNAGAIWNGGFVDLINDTIFANSAIEDSVNPPAFGNGQGGGIWNAGFMHIANTTVTANSASVGGGLWSGGFTNVANSIIAANPSGANCTLGSPANYFTDDGHNLDDDNTCPFDGLGCTSGAGTSQCGVPANLDPLGPADHGGSTQTIALCSAVGTPAGCVGASPAIGAGDQTICAATTGDEAVGGVDQRGYGRPGAGQSSCSIGAYEPGASRICPASPQTGCRTAGGSTLSWKQKGGTKDKLTWSWTKGAAIAQTDFGFPTVSTEELLCLYSGPSSTLLSEIHVPASATLWSSSAAGYRYKEKTGSAGGIRSMMLKGGASGKSKITVGGAGANLPDPALASIMAPLTVQLVNDTTDVCAEAVFDANDIAQQDASRLKAKLRP